MNLGMPTVSSGSQITTAGSTLGWKMIFFWWVTLSVITRGAAHFGTRACGGRHRDDRRDGIGIGAGPPVADILKIPDRAGLALP